MEVARAFVRIPPSGPCSHDQCRCSQEKKNGSCIDDRNKGNEHVAGHQSCTRRQIIIPDPLTRPLSRRPAAPGHDASPEAWRHGEEAPNCGSLNMASYRDADGFYALAL